MISLRFSILVNFTAGISTSAIYNFIILNTFPFKSKNPFFWLLKFLILLPLSLTNSIFHSTFINIRYFFVS